MVQKETKTFRGKTRSIIIEDFRHKQKQLFWNILYYFTCHTLPFDYILCYSPDKFVNKVEKEFETTNSPFMNLFNKDSEISKMMEEENYK